MVKYRIDEGDQYVAVDHEPNEGKERRYVFNKTDDTTVSFQAVRDPDSGEGSPAARVPNDVIQQLVIRGWAVYFSR